MNELRDRNRFINGILIVVAVGLLAASIYSVYLAWRTGLAQSRAETTSRMMAIRTSPRTSDTPGVNAWVAWSLLHGTSSDTTASIEQMQRLVSPHTGNQIPSEMRSLLQILRSQSSEQVRKVAIQSDTKESAIANEALEFRKVSILQNGEQFFVLTARKNTYVQSTIDDFAETASTHLSKINEAWKRQSSFPALSQLGRIRSARVARFYVLNEDESLISLPLADSVNDNQSSQNRSDVHLSEADEFRKNPLSPSFVSNNFFFTFQYSRPLDDQASYSGMYLDLGGLGLVASVMTPVIYDGKRAVVGADVAFDMDWEEFAGSLSNNLTSHVAHIQNADTANWNPWREFAKSLSTVSKSDTKLRDELNYLAELESRRTEPLARKSIYLATARDGGDVTAIQVDRSTWLLLVTGSEIQLPWTTMLLTSLVFLTLLFRIELSRRKAVVAQRSARNEMLEKQNLLETMQVPLMVVDPNTDEIVFCNRAAEAIGMSQGDFFGKDIVAQDRDSQEHYSKTQTLGEEHRRAYGVPIKGGPANDNEGSFAIVRSVAVTAPIESLKADERHRLGILFLIDEHRDLDILLNQRVAETRKIEKRQLSSLMNHGIDSLARILKNQLESCEPLTKEQCDFVHWLSSYLSERIQLMAWALENWGMVAPMNDQVVIERTIVERTFDRFSRVFSVAAADRRLREQLHWNNGVVSEAANDSSAGKHILTAIDWSDEACFTVPRNGVFGFFISEALVNAVRHGKPGSQIEFTVEENRVRNELNFLIKNQAREINHGSNEERAKQLKPYSGTVIMTELARISGWSEPQFVSRSGIHSVSWSVPLIRRKPSAASD